jgi:putative ABC transport system permease protein
MLFQDVRIAVRHLRKSAGFSAIVIAMLGLGIGATTAIFSIVEGVLLRPLLFSQPERLVSLSDILQGANIGGNGEAGVTATDIVAYTRDTHSFESLGGYRPESYELSGVGEPDQVNVARLSAGVFPALSVAPLLGRFFTEQEDVHSEAVTLISYAFWQNRLHGDPQVLGTKILLDRKPYLVIGVMPRNFEFPLMPGHLNNSELWVPLSLTSEDLQGGRAMNWEFRMVARLKPGISFDQAQQDAQRVAEQTMRGYPPYMAGLRIQASVHSLREETVSQARDLLRTLFLAIFVVLLIACANLVGLLLVRAIHRRHEIALRLALGAGSFALLRQSLLESLLLSLTGGVLGLVFAAVGLRIGVSYLPETLPRIDEIGLDWRIVVFALALSILTGIGCGIIPALAGLKTSVNETLKEGGRTRSGGVRHVWMRSAIVIGEVATALVLLAAAGLLLRSFEKMRSVDLGYRPDHVLAAAYSLPRKQYPTQASVDAFNHALCARLQQLPGVKYTGLTNFLPASGNNGNSTFIVEGYVPAAGAGMNLATWMQIDGDYFQAMGIPLLAGRFFSPADTAHTQLVAIVNHKFAEHYWRDATPLGKRFRIGTRESPTPWLTVVGEVADVKENSPDEPTNEQWYQPIDQIQPSVGSIGSPDDLNGNGVFIALRTAEPPQQMTNAVRAVVRALDPQLPISPQTMEQSVADTETPRRFQTALISAFAAAASLLAGLGIYGVIAFSTALRVQEMAVRMALGSPRSGILGLVLLSAIKLALAGCGLGLLGSVTALRLMDSLLFEVSPFDPIVLTLSAVFIVMLALAASLLPARRAASIDPMQSLRAE